MQVLIIAGPTAVGKSELGLALAHQLGGEILCADSMQVYRGMDIGTAKPSLAEQAQIPHHLIDLVAPSEHFNAAMYVEAFTHCIKGVAERGRLPIVVGGTGLYIRAAVRPFLFPDSGGRPELRARYQAMAQTEGAEALHALLAKVDARAAARIQPADTRRVIRALEVFEATGRPITDWQNEAAPASPYELVFLCLTRDRAELYARIEARAEVMLAAGFLEEVRGLLRAGYAPELPAMQGLGYRELGAHLAGKCSLPEALATIKQRTRQYAKRQLTWFRREPDVRWYNLTSLTPAVVLGEILRLLEGRQEDPSNNNRV